MHGGATSVVLPREAEFSVRSVAGAEADASPPKAVSFLTVVSFAAGKRFRFVRSGRRAGSNIGFNSKIIRPVLLSGCL